jgi:hypothetical protein
MYVGSAPPPRSRQALIFALVFLLGLGGGFVLAQFIGRSDDRVPDENLVLYETASMTFPVEGAQFTRSTYNPETKQCDKEALKRFLRADPRRFKAWIDLQGITEDQFDGFVDRLETRITTGLTAFTNHGCFREGDGPCPFALQSVLAPGTPVWFDPVQQRVVAKCPCSNPLKPPRCPPNCENKPTPTPSPSASPTRSPTQPPRTTPPRTQPPRTPEPSIFTSFEPRTEPPTEPPLDCQKNPNDPRCVQPPP